MQKVFIPSLLSLATVVMAAAAATVMDVNKKDWPDVMRNNPTRKTPMMVDTPYGSIHWGDMYSLANATTTTTTTTSTTSTNNDRSLQGFGNDPNACVTDGEYFICKAPNVFTAGANTTQVENNIRCLLDDAIGYDFQARPESCTCSARLTQGDRIRDCACAVCPYGRPQAVALDCRVWPDDPFVAGPCTFLDCDGRCNGTGSAVVNQPTPAPYGEGLDEESDSSGVSSNVYNNNNNHQIVVTLLLVGTWTAAVSIASTSIYC